MCYTEWHWLPTSPRIRKSCYMSCVEPEAAVAATRRWSCLTGDVQVVTGAWSAAFLFIHWNRPDVPHISPSETVNTKRCKGHCRPTEAGQPRLLMVGNRTVETPKWRYDHTTQRQQQVWRPSFFFSTKKKEKRGKESSRGPLRLPPLLPLLCLWCHLIINNLLLKCLWYVNDMLILPINLSFTSRGLLCAEQQHQQSRRAEKGALAERRRETTFHISRSSSLSCVPSYIWIKKGTEKERNHHVLL